MCRKESCCRNPEEFKEKPQDCSPEQIEKCHGDGKGHPCVSENEKQDSK
jgi:hypothetical protein